MPLTQEEKDRRKVERRDKKYAETHKFINDIDHKVCSICKEYFPSTEEHFHPNKSNGIDGLSPYCKSCNSKKSVIWQKEHPEEFKAWVKYYNTTEVRKLQKRKEWQNGRKRGRLSNWQNNNPDKVKLYNEKRRQNKKHDISPMEWFYCRFYFDNKCAYCGMSWEDHFVQHKKDFHKEHFDDDGSNNLLNCIPSCTVCNSEKHIFSFSEWYNSENAKYNKTRESRIIQWISHDSKRFFKVN